MQRGQTGRRNSRIWAGHQGSLDKGVMRCLPGQKCVEREVRNEDTVQELHDPREHEEDKERIDEFQSLRRIVRVRFPQRLGCIGGRRGLLLRDGLLRSHWPDNS